MVRFFDLQWNFRPFRRFRAHIMSRAKLSVSPILSPSPGGAASRGAATGVLLRYPSRGCVPRSGASRLSERQGAGFGGGSYRLKWKVTPKLPTRRPGLGGWLQYSTNGSGRSEEHTSELQSLMRRSDDVFCLKTKK